MSTVDDQMRDIVKRLQAKLWPSELVTHDLGICKTPMFKRIEWLATARTLIADY